MTAFFIIISLSLITFRIIKRSEFYENRRLPEQVISPFICSLVESYKNTAPVCTLFHKTKYRNAIDMVVSHYLVKSTTLKNGLVGLTLILLFVFSLSSPVRAEYSPKQPSINLDDIESGQLLMRAGNE